MKFGRARMIESIERLTGETCLEAVACRGGASIGVLVLVGAPVFVITIAVLSPSLGTIPGAVVAGAFLGGAYSLLAETWVVGRVGETVVLARSKKLYVEAVEVVSTHLLPLPPGSRADVGIMAKLTLGAHELQFVPAMRARLRTIVGPSSQA